MTRPRLIGSITPAAPDTRSSELLVLIPSLGTTSAVWHAAASEIRRSAPCLRILCIDLPGHGASPATHEKFTIAELSEATLRLVDEAGGGSFYVAGISLGGVVALELSASHPERVLGFAAFCSGSRIGDAASWAERAAQVRASGTASVVAGSAGRWYSPGHLEAHPTGAAARGLGALLDIDDESYALCTEALASFDRTPDLPGIAVPAVIVAGEHDTVTTSASMRGYAEALPNARFAEISNAGHLAPLERPVEAAALVLELLHTPDDDRASMHASGMAVRRAVLGEAHVDRATAASTPETAVFQDFITRYAWGEIWARDELSRRERSIATLASLVTGGHDAEIRMHVGAALRNGLTRKEVSEVILHTALYAGLPAANAALAIMRDVFTDEQPTPGDPNHG